MNIKIHRGTHQIGGCVTEYEYDGWRLFVDYGEELPGGPKSGDLKVEGLTHGDISKSALLITHYHGDHIGNITKLPKTLPIYMGELSRDIQLELSNHLRFVDGVQLDMIERLKDVHVFKAGSEFNWGAFTVMPVTIDHSAFDAYAFRIEADGVSAFHTGDFRTHGFRSSKISEMIKKYLKKVDYVVSEATNVVRPSSISEYALQKKYEQAFKEQKGNVVYVSSTNIDRLFSLYHAALAAGLPFYVDAYQKRMMDTVVKSDSIWTKSILYQYGKYEPKELLYDYHDRNCFLISDDFKDFLNKIGYVLIARSNPRFDDLIKRIPGEKHIFLSMWEGYVKEDNEAYNENLAKSVGKKYKCWHTSGHVNMDDLRDFFRLLTPKVIIPIHTDNPEAFVKEFGDEWTVKLLNDGDSLH